MPPSSKYPAFSCRLSLVFTAVCASALTILVRQVFRTTVSEVVLPVMMERPLPPPAIPPLRGSAAAAPAAVAPPPPPAAALTVDSLTASGSNTPPPTPPATATPSLPAASVSASPSPAEAEAVEDTDTSYLEGTAIMILATGDNSARHAVALVQSLRDVGTRVPRIVALLSRGGVGSAHCLNFTHKEVIGRLHVQCDGPDTVEEEIVDPQYLAALKRLGAETMIIDPVPDTNYTVITGGRATWWGMSLNKIRIFGACRPGAAAPCYAVCVAKPNLRAPCWVPACLALAAQA